MVTLLNELKDVKILLGKDQALAAISKTKSDVLAGSLKDCGRDGSCFINRMKFTTEEINAVSERLSTLYAPGNALDILVKKHLLPSGTYILYNELPAKEMLVKAWQQDAGAINRAIDIYAGGHKPNYPLIDSISFNTRDAVNRDNYRASYVSFLYNTANVVLVESQSSPAFYALPLTAALLSIEMNERNQAADYEPMEKGQNKAAYEQVRKTNWNNYKYSVILIPGAGPDEPAVALSAEGMLRCRLAANQYKQGLAPFLMPSGGCVHPYKTKFNEAIEMKKYLMETLGVPEHAIIIEPHARHTTTNMRNGVRLMFRYGMPMSKPGLTTTTRGQSTMIGSTLIDRCQKEINVVPYKNGNRLGETSIEFYPMIAALQLDWDEPMDP
ncbi:MAG: YdcF family protein [Chitinophagaceae bacterium]|nr:MAG: YdcF family protein [Chitinophagaceae bacterium]